MLTTRAPGGAEQTWRPPLRDRVAGTFTLGIWLAQPLLIFAPEMPGHAWIALALTVAVWGLLAWRVLTRAVTLTPDSLVIRNTLATRHVPLARLTGVSFRRGRLTITRARGTGAGKPITASAVSLGSSRWTGLPTGADATAEAITAAAGLPPLPPRREIITRIWAWILLLAAALCLGIGVWGLVRSWTSRMSSVSVAVLFGTEIMLGAGAIMVTLGFAVIRDHHRRGTRPAAGARI